MRDVYLKEKKSREARWDAREPRAFQLKLRGRVVLSAFPSPDTLACMFELGCTPKLKTWPGNGWNRGPSFPLEPITCRDGSMKWQLLSWSSGVVGYSWLGPVKARRGAWYSSCHFPLVDEHEPEHWCERQGQHVTVPLGMSGKLHRELIDERDLTSWPANPQETSAAGQNMMTIEVPADRQQVLVDKNQAPPATMTTTSWNVQILSIILSLHFEDAQSQCFINASILLKSMTARSKQSHI